MTTKQEILVLISCICHNLTFFLVSNVFMSFLTDVSAQNCQSEHFDCAVDFAFQESVANLQVFQNQVDFQSIIYLYGPA